MMKTTKALTIILTLPAIATSASAECAWVMWNEVTGADGTSTRLIVISAANNLMEGRP